MSKPLRVIGTIAGAAALVATGVGAFAVAGTALAATAGTVAGIASLTAGIATIGSQLLAKPPPARGSLTQIMIAADAPQPYVMGEGYYAGVLRHDAGYGPTLNKVPNPYRFMPVVYSGSGPVESISPRVDYQPATSWYTGFLFTTTQLGTTPQPTALTPQWAGVPGWGPSHRLSGQAAIGWSFRFDKDGKRFASGLPLIGAYGRWVKVYDPRKDSTQPGGSGPHRLGTESTYEWSENPALHAGAYAFGRYQNGKRVFGIGIPREGIDWAVIMAWANVCDANAWTIFGVIHEPGNRMQNLREICFAGGGEPILGSRLSFKYSAPTVALDTVTELDLTDEDASVMAMQSYRDRINTAVPKFTSPEHNWELIDAAPHVNETFLEEDGFEKRQTWPFNLVKKATQATQLAAYRTFDSRELSPIVLHCHPRLRHFRPGECLHLDIPKLNLDTPAVIINRQFDVATRSVTLTLMSETPGKHPYCLGRVGESPPTPAIGQTAEERDAVAAAVTTQPRAARQIIAATQTVVFPVTSDATSITIQAFEAVIDDGRIISFPEASFTDLSPATSFVLLWDTVAEEYILVLTPATAASADSNNVIVRYVMTASGEGTYPPQPTPPGGDGGSGYHGLPITDMP